MHSKSVVLKPALIAFCLIALTPQGCNVFERSSSDQSKQNTVTNRSVIDGDTVFEGIFIDEISNAGSMFRYCPYYAQVPMQYDDAGGELPIIDQLIAAGESGKNGQLVFLQAGDLKVNLPFSAQDFNAALDQFDRDANGRTPVGAWLRRTGQQFSLVGNALDGAATQFSNTLTLSSRKKRESGLGLQEELISKRIELVTRALLSKETVERVAEIAALEHSPASSDLQRLGSGGRDLGIQEQSETFALMAQVYAMTARHAKMTKGKCQDVTKLVSRFRELKQSDLSY